MSSSQPSNSSAAGLTQEEQEQAEGNLLYHCIVLEKVHGLNLTVPEDAHNVFKAWESRHDITRFCESNADDQMIIHVVFAEAVMVRSVVLKIGRGELAPQRLRLYANAPGSSDFGDLEDMRPDLDLSLQQNEDGVVEYPLRAQAFVNTSSIALFFSEATGGEQSRVYYVGFRGLRKHIWRAPMLGLKVHEDAAGEADIDRLAEKSGSKTSTIK
ncbi:DUF1000-domain-containing protein [Auricularia subglabra TFB-10046 SS5]|nr:DUF1000-domain-containing protein [Auricularia subglabra TFB-10046 SS5]